MRAIVFPVSITPSFTLTATAVVVRPVVVSVPSAIAPAAAIKAVKWSTTG
jgi:hypothetical protein